jgi:hypothetical protein
LHVQSPNLDGKTKPQRIKKIEECEYFRILLKKDVILPEYSTELIYFNVRVKPSSIHHSVLVLSRLDSAENVVVTCNIRPDKVADPEGRVSFMLWNTSSSEIIIRKGSILAILFEERIDS